jgi:hypothetical protein
MRVAVILLACVGLLAPSTHGIALCIGCDGRVTLEAAVDGACAGAQPEGCCRRTSCEGESESDSHQHAIGSSDQHGECQDALLGRDAAPPSETFSAKRPVSRSGQDAVTADPATDLGARPATDAGATSCDRGMPPPSFLRTVVLRL